MREIKHIVIHCTATHQSATVDAIQNYWRQVLKWKSPGYHRIIKANGEVVTLAPYANPTNGVGGGWNTHSIHISYIGGVDRANKPIDNRTPEQLKVMEAILRDLIKEFPKAEVCGHRDFPGVKKACPSFDVKAWLAKMNIK
jgi:N-acetylmuramoyl-L-alanine amidase